MHAVFFGSICITRFFHFKVKAGFNVEQIFGDLVYAAIEEKYGSRTLDDVRRIVSDAVFLFRQTSSELQLLQCTAATSNFHSDVINQALCLYAIEEYWRFKLPKQGFVLTVHAVTYGMRIADVRMRIESFVPDFGGTVPWDCGKIGEGLNAIEKLLSTVWTLGGATPATKGMFLADVFASLIRVHPFEDGNGRTARMLVQYCLRFWGDDYIVIPKVRNSPEWKDCLDRGVNGDYQRLGGYFQARIQTRMEL